MILVAVYLAAIVTANLTVAAFGPAITPITAFLLIGLDLTTRDALHDRWHRSHLPLRMASPTAPAGRTGNSAPPPPPLSPRRTCAANGPTWAELTATAASSTPRRSGAGRSTAASSPGSPRHGFPMASPLWQLRPSQQLGATA